MNARFIFNCLFNNSLSQSRSFHSKSAKEMAEELSKEIGRNSVCFKSVDKNFHIDLAGRQHFDKRSQQYIPTPHVQGYQKHTNFFGKERFSKLNTVPATKDDVRFARKLAGR